MIEAGMKLVAVQPINYLDESHRHRRTGSVDCTIPKGTTVEVVKVIDQNYVCVAYKTALVQCHIEHFAGYEPKYINEPLSPPDDIPF